MTKFNRYLKWLQVASRNNYLKFMTNVFFENLKSHVLKRFTIFIMLDLQRYYDCAKFQRLREREIENIEN